MNIRSRMYDLLGNPKEEIPNHCGCYIEPGRGVLKVTDVNPEDIEQLIPGLPKECFHVQDYQFFFYNLKKNVMDRKAVYFGKRRIRSEARLHQVFSDRYFDGVKKKRQPLGHLLLGFRAL